MRRRLTGYGEAFQPPPSKLQSAFSEPLQVGRVLDRAAAVFDMPVEEVLSGGSAALYGPQPGLLMGVRKLGLLRLGASRQPLDLLGALPVGAYQRVGTG